MKTIRTHLDDQTHAQFKAACALQGMAMNKALREAVRDLLARWQSELAIMKAMERASEQAEEKAQG